MKKGGNNARVADQQVIAFLEEVLVEQGYMLPREPEHITTDDLALYGKGTTRTLDEVRRSFESLMGKRFVVADTARDVSESLAMAARNGTVTSDEVWARMRKDRESAEAERERHD